MIHFKRRLPNSATMAAVLIALQAVAAVSAMGQNAADRAREILASTDVQGGLAVHLGCGDGRLAGALVAEGRFLVHGLDRDGDDVQAARRFLRANANYGVVSVEQFAGGRLPYADNLVKLLIVDDATGVTASEIHRVLCPDGAAYVATDQDGAKFDGIKFDGAAPSGLVARHLETGAAVYRKPRPEAIDEWTHFLHDASGNAVAQDTVVGPPRQFQWIAGPRWARSHDHLASMSAMVSARGRVFYIVDEGPIAAVAIEPQWSLVARDAFSGVLLWKRPVGPWEGHLRGFRTGPTELARRLVAVGERVYVTLGYGQPISVLDAATGASLRSYDETANALEIIVHDGTVIAVVGDRVPDNTDGAAKPIRPTNIWHWWPIYEDTPPRKHLVALAADTGELLWKKADDATAEMMPTTLAAAGQRVFFQSHDSVVALGATTGEVLWNTPRPTSRRRPAWSAPTLVVYGDVVLSGDRAVDSPPHPSAPETDAASQWVVDSQGGIAPRGRIVALSVDTGQPLWESPCRECYNAPVDILVADDLVWSGFLVGKAEPGITAARDVQTGEVRRERSADQKHFPIQMGHHRCYRNKATENYLVLGRDGIELIDVATGEGDGNAWVRGTCQYGVMPCNGLIYAPPHSCACHIESKLNSFNVLAPDSTTGTDTASADPVEIERLEKGVAYGVEVAAVPSPPMSDWPTYRHDARRSGRSSCAVPAALQPAWTTQLPADRVSSPVVADGRVFVACPDQHAVWALDARSGGQLWSYTAGGRVDSPPTIHGPLAIFGSADGWIYALRTDDGRLAWRFLAASQQRRIVSYGQLESAWPVHGSVLVQNGEVYAVAGRSTYLDGGMTLYRLDALTGEQLSATPITRPGLPDVLSSDGESVFVRHLRFDLRGVAQKGDVTHLYSPAGFLDDSWWHRTYWIVGTGMRSGWGSWPISGNRMPAGRLLVLDDSQAYGFGRFNQYHRDGSHVGLGKTRYYLYASAEINAAQPTEVARRRSPSQGALGGDLPSRWSTPLPLLARGMVLAGDTIFVAGPPDVFAYAPDDTTDPYHIVSAEALREQRAALEGERGGLLMAVSAKDGQVLAECKLPTSPAWDAMAAAGGRLYLAVGGGKVLCLDGGD